MFENPRRGRQARNFTTNVPKILDLKSSSEQIFLENWHWVPLITSTLCLKNVLLFLKGFGICLNGSGYPFQKVVVHSNGLGYLFGKNCRPFEQLGLSVSKKKINVIHLNGLGCPFGKHYHLFEWLRVSVSINCYPFERLGLSVSKNCYPFECYPFKKEFVGRWRNWTYLFKDKF